MISIRRAARAPIFAICSARIFNLACKGVSSCSIRNPFFFFFFFEKAKKKIIIININNIIIIIIN